MLYPLVSSSKFFKVTKSKIFVKMWHSELQNLCRIQNRIRSRIRNQLKSRILIRERSFRIHSTVSLELYVRVWCGGEGHVPQAVPSKRGRRGRPSSCAPHRSHVPRVVFAATRSASRIMPGTYNLSNVKSVPVFHQYSNRNGWFFNTFDYIFLRFGTTSLK